MLNERAEQAPTSESTASGDGERTKRAAILRVAAHDLRGPLANIKSYVSLLRATKTPLEPRVQRSLEVIARNADRALALVDEGLDAARFESGALTFDKVELPSTTLIEQAVEACRRQAQPLQVEIDAQIPADLPAIHADPLRMRRAVEALIMHLVTRSTPGQHVSLRAWQGGGQLHVHAYSPEGVVAATECFGGSERILQERAFEDPIRLWLAEITAEAHGGLVRRVEDSPHGLQLDIPLAS